MPLSSDRECPEIAEKIDWQYGKCPYKNSPSRNPHGVPHKIPMSFLERDRLSQAFPDMLQIVEDVRQVFIAERGLSADLLLYDARALLKGLKFLPTYLVARGDNAFSPDQVLPPTLIVLSNSASGSLGATGSLLDRNLLNPDPANVIAVPDVDKAIGYTEEIGSMVGQKTVCAAYPAMMKRFINTAVHGREVSDRQPPMSERTKFNIWDFLKPEELPSLIDFAESLEFCHEAFAVLSHFDFEASTKLKEHIKKKHSDRRMRQVVADYIAKAELTMHAVVAHQVRMNVCLGRESFVAGTSLEDYKDYARLEMLDLIDGLSESQIPRHLLTQEQRTSHVAVDLGSSIWRLMAESDGVAVPMYLR